MFISRHVQFDEDTFLFATFCSQNSDFTGSTSFSQSSFTSGSFSQPSDSSLSLPTAVNFSPLSTSLLLSIAINDISTQPLVHDSTLVNNCGSHWFHS